MNPDNLLPGCQSAEAVEVRGICECSEEMAAAVSDGPTGVAVRRCSKR